MTARLVPPASSNWSLSGVKGIRIAVRLPPEQALDQVVAGLVAGRRFRLKGRTSPTSAHLAIGKLSSIFLDDFSLLFELVPRRLRVGHWGLIGERVDIDAEPGADAWTTVVWIHPRLGSDTQVAAVLSDDLEPVAAALAASGHLLWVGQWEKIDQKAEILRAREQKRTAKTRRRTQ